MPFSLKTLKKITAGIVLVSVVLAGVHSLPAGSFDLIQRINAQAQPPAPPLPPATSSTQPADPVAPGGGQKVNPLGCTLTEFALNFVTCVIYAVTLIITGIFGFFVSVAAFLAEFALKLSQEVTSSPVVQAGFQISLAFANLGFVLGIIVIAIATILRIQSYGMKQLLFKLIAMAILVNFSMVLAGTMLRASDSVSQYFIQNASPPGPIGDPGGYKNFITAMARGFGPQKLFGVSSSTTAESAFNDISGLLGNFHSNVLYMVFIMVFLLLITLVFLTLAVMLLIRYVYLGVLLILMPLAWMMWVFPAFKKFHSQWWDKFLHWVFFAPVMLFFIYLAVLGTSGSQQYKNYLTDQRYQYRAGVDDPGSAIVKVLGGNAATVLNSLGQMIITLGLVFGGFFAANKMGITGAAAVKGALESGAKGLGKSAVGWAGKKSSGAASRYLTTPPTPNQSRLRKFFGQGILAPKDAPLRAVAQEKAVEAEKARKIAHDEAINLEKIRQDVSAAQKAADEEKDPTRKTEKLKKVEALKEALKINQPFVDVMLHDAEEKKKAAEHAANVLKAVKSTGLGAELANYAAEAQKAPGFAKAVLLDGLLKGSGIIGGGHGGGGHADPKKVAKALESLGLHGLEVTAKHGDDEGGGDSAHGGGGTAAGGGGGGGAAAPH